MDVRTLLAAMYEAVHRPEADEAWTQIYPSCIEGDVNLIFKRAAAAVLRVASEELEHGNDYVCDRIAEDYRALAKELDASQP